MAAEFCFDIEFVGPIEVDVIVLCGGEVAGGLVGGVWLAFIGWFIFAASREEEFIDKIKGMSYADIAAKGGGILNSAKKLNQISEDELFNLAWKRLEEIAKMGTGAVEIKSGPLQHACETVEAYAFFPIRHGGRRPRAARATYMPQMRPLCFVAFWNLRRFSDARLHALSSRYMYSEHGLDALMRPVFEHVCQRLIVLSY